MNTNLLKLKRALGVTLLVMLLTMAGLTKATAQTFTVGNLNYSLNSDGASVTVTGHVDGTAATGELVIPESIEIYGVSYPVTTIAPSAFGNCKNLTGSLVIPNSVVTIGNNAFHHCTGLTGSLVIPNSVVTIQYYAFNGCTGFTGSLTIGDAVITIGQGSFNNCTGFTGSLIIGNSVQTIDDDAFSHCGFTGTLIIPENVKHIYSRAFDSCNFTSLEYNAINCGLGYSINLSTGEYSYWLTGCNTLTSLTIGDNVVVIDDNFINGVTSITGDLVIPNNVTTIGANAFSGCTGLSGTFTLGHAVTEIGNTAFFGACENITSYVFMPDTPPTLGNNVFASANYATPVSVHCGSVEAYQAVAGWSSFTNYQELDPCLWVVKADLGDMAYGGTISGGNGIYQQGQTCTLIATPNEGYRFVNWMENGEVVSTNATYTFTVTSDRDLIAHFTYDYAVAIGIGSTGTTTYLPTYTYSYYSLSQQIYTSDEIGAAGEINRLAFYNGSNYINTRNCDVYLVHTDKTNFSNTTDWVPVTLADKVYSGDVTFITGDWTTITLDTPFTYNGISNLLLVVDDNSGTGYRYSNYMNCRVYSSGAYKTLYRNNSDTNYNPLVAQDGGSRTTNKNQVIFGFASTPSYNINLSVNPAESGWVSGAGAYQEGESCTVTASAYENYAFLNWTENGEVVSTDAAYTFTVTKGRSLVANFKSMANHWTPESANYPDNMGLTGVVLIDGVEQHTDEIEVGVFCGTECRGTNMASYFPPTDRYIVMLTIYGNNGDNLTFKLYDHDTEQELELISPSTVTFNTDGYGTPIVPYELNFTSTVSITATVTPAGAGTVTGSGEYFPGDNCTLTATANAGYQFKNWTLNNVEVSTNPTYSFTVGEAAEYVANFNYAHTRVLVAGWNWYSTYIELNGIDGLTMLENSLGDAGIRIQGRNGYTEQFEYQGTKTWYGTLTSITNEQMYKVRTNAACNAVMVGDAASAANHPITINKGWNWIGYPTNQSVSVTNALSGFTPEADDIIKGRNGYSTYISYPGYTMWYGTLNTLEPGHGYMYKSNSNTAKTLTFQTGSKGDEIANITPENNMFVPEVSEFSDNMTVTAVIDIDGEELRSTDYELVAIVNGECRGSVKLMYVEPIDRYVAFLTVFGETAEDVSFVLTDGTETRWSNDMMVYSSDATLGTLSAPETISFGVLGVDDNEQMHAVVYPNPSRDVFNVVCEGIKKIEVLNIYGQVVYSNEMKADNIRIDLGEYSSGTYMLRIYTDNGIISKNLIKN